MDVATATWLVSDAATPALALALAEPDPSSLAAATRLRAWCTPAQAAAVLTQAALRRRAVAKFDDLAGRLFLTPDGLEQATRAPVARRRAARYRDLGATRVVDFGCGLGADALEMLGAGLEVVAVEADEVTAILAAANLGALLRRVGGPVPLPRVLTGRAEELAEGLLTDGSAVFCDPARRTAAGRSWRVEDLSPSWEFVSGLLDGSRTACVKLGPGLPRSLIGDRVDAEWVSDAGAVVEAALWAGPGTVPGRRRAVVDGHELARDEPLAEPPVGPLDAYLYEPDGAVIRAGLGPAVAAAVGGHRVHAEVAYLTGPRDVPTPFATAFEVVEVLRFDERVLRSWVRARGIGILEIKKRGLDFDPAALRRRLRPSGAATATIVATPTPAGAVVAVVRRV